MRIVLNWTRHSIARNLSVGLVVILLAVSGIGLSLSSRLSASRAWAELEAKAEEYSAALVENLTLPLWNYDLETMQRSGGTQRRRDSR